MSSSKMPHSQVEKAKTELEEARSQLDAALRAWDGRISVPHFRQLSDIRAQSRHFPSPTFGICAGENCISRDPPDGSRSERKFPPIGRF
jgi:hypothetical protein